MNITADTNVLLRAALLDEPEQSPLASAVLRGSERSVITLPALCEFVSVLSRGYKRPAPRIAAAVRRLTNTAKAQVDRGAVEAGLEVLEAGGDFADGVIAYEGRRLGGPIFVSFDRKAVSLVVASGGEARLLSKDH